MHDKRSPLVEPPYVLSLSANIIETSFLSRGFDIAGLARRVLGETIQTALLFSVMTHSAFPTASSCTAEQPAPKNPATSESLTGVAVLGLTKVHLHGPKPHGLWRIFRGFSLANKAAALLTRPAF
jgi:hypothetical protein